MSICAECWDEVLKWRDTSPATLLAVRIASGATYDDTAVGVSDNRRSRWQKWRDLVKFQERLIRTACAAQHVQISGADELREAA